MDSRDVVVALDEMERVLGPRTGADWSVPAGPLEWDCRDTAAHVAHDLLGYAGQVTARPDRAYLPMDLTVRPTATPQDVLRIAAAAGGMLVAALDAAEPGLRAWHFGPCDPPGFAAMGVAEILLHTHDITRALAPGWRPPDGLCAAVLQRLFPHVPFGDAGPDGERPDPVDVLLWATGRAVLPGRERLTSWRWFAAVPQG